MQSVIQSGKTIRMARFVALTKGVVRSAPVGPILVGGAVADVPTAGSLLRCKRFVALGAAQPALSQALGGAARAVARIRRLSITVEARVRVAG